MKEISQDDLEQCCIIKRYAKKRSVYRKKRAVGALMKIIERHGPAPAEWLNDHYIGLTERQFRSLLFVVFLNMKEKPAWMQSIVQMRKDGLLRQDGSTAGNIF